jgi:pimeloyl-ACP methyl ester carboxylesterase
MPIASIDGHDIAYDLYGEGNTEGTWICTPGGRFTKDDPGFPLLAEALVEAGRQVILWDRPNCGASEVRFDGHESESEIQADALAGLVEHLGVGPVMMQGGSGGARVTLLAGLRHPEICKGMSLNWITGTSYGLMGLANVYCFPSYEAAFHGGMQAVADHPTWAEVIERNPKNREIILSQDRDAFLETMNRWAQVYCESPTSLIPGALDSDLASFDKPVLVWNSGTADIHHPRKLTEAVAALLPNARLVEPPWPDDEWAQRMAENAAKGNGLFRRWYLLAPALVEFEDSIS